MVLRGGGLDGLVFLTIPIAREHISFLFLLASNPLRGERGYMKEEALGYLLLGGNNRLLPSCS
nr:hypothetical protein [uncultured archaeon]